jgi:hypothetical protein
MIRLQTARPMKSSGCIIRIMSTRVAQVWLFGLVLAAILPLVLSGWCALLTSLNQCPCLCSHRGASREPLPANAENIPAGSYKARCKGCRVVEDSHLECSHCPKPCGAMVGLHSRSCAHAVGPRV